MFEKAKALWRWFTGLNKKAKSESFKVAYQLKKGDKVPEGFRVCVFDGKNLVEVTDVVSNEMFKKGCQCWAVKSEAIEIALISNGLETTAKIQLEPSFALGNLLEGREFLSLDVLQAVVQTQFAGFVGLMQGSAQSLERLDDEKLASYCARFNLLLTSNGLKCLEMGKFAASENLVTPPSVEEVEKELHEAVKPIHTQLEWNTFAQNIQAEGFPMAWDSSEMSDLGKKYLDNRITSEQCVHQIREFAELAFLAAQDTKTSNYWDGLEVRLRLNSTFKDEPEPEDEVKPASLNVTMGRSRRPKKGWFTRYITLDQSLQEFLKTKLDYVKSVFETERASAKDVRMATELRNCLTEIDTIQTLLKSTPVLNSKTSSFRVDKAKPAEMVKVMNQAVTAAEFLEAAVVTREIFKTYPLPSEIRNALADLKIQLETRYHTR